MSWASQLQQKNLELFILVSSVTHPKRARWLKFLQERSPSLFPNPEKEDHTCAICCSQPKKTYVSKRGTHVQKNFV